MNTYFTCIGPGLYVTDIRDNEVYISRKLGGWGYFCETGSNAPYRTIEEAIADCSTLLSKQEGAGKGC